MIYLVRLTLICILDMGNVFIFPPGYLYICGDLR
jgi:hypothetical protein